MATNTIIPLTDEDMRAIEDLLSELKDRARQAEKDRKTLLLGIYTRLISLVSPEVVRLHARLEREEKAAFNRGHKNLRKADREALEQNNATT